MFIYLYEVDIIQGLLKKNEKKLSKSFNLNFRNVMLSFHYIILSFVILLMASISISLDLKKRIPQIQLGLFHTLTYTSKLTAGGG